MLSVDEALALVLQHARPQKPVKVAARESLGLILAETLTSDVDVPPRDQSIVDGYALRAADAASGSAELAVIEEVTAGRVPQRALAAGEATRIMTGVAIPAGADCVVMIEQTEFTAAGPTGKVRILKASAPAQNIMRRAASLARGAVALAAGGEIRPIELGIIAEVGRAEVSVIPRPTLAVIATGDELVEVSAIPGPGQIRNSNGPMLLACAARAGATPIDAGVGRDEQGQLQATIAAALNADVVVLSGGVSMGVVDLVPGTLATLGVEQVFHKVRLKPGKPLWFGVLRTAAGDKLVFGLPGNPVSSLVCFELFVRPAIARLLGRAECGPLTTRARLTKPHEHRGERPTYHPARLTHTSDGATIEPLPWRGSGDLATLAAANALAHFPPGDSTHAMGAMVEVIPLF